MISETRSSEPAHDLPMHNSVHSPMHNRVEGVRQQLEDWLWTQRAQPVGPYCEWPRWKGGDPGERWPESQA